VKKGKDANSSEDSDTGSKYPKVAVLYAVGPIVLGGSESGGLSNDEQIASNEIIASLDEIKKDSKIKAVILRVNSPGGSAFASDLIWRKMEELKREKPVIATMSDVAASGGYYISMGATKIIAEPGTLTGSIGVVGGKPNLSGLYEKAGVRKTTIAKGDYAQLYSETSSFNDKERAVIERMMKRTYDDFVTKAAVGRKSTYDKVHEVAQGRVWTGVRAKEVGLVDELGGMGKAISETKSLLGLKNDDRISLVSYPKELSLFDYLQKAMGSGATARVQTQSLLSSLVSGWDLFPVGLRNALTTALTVSTMFKHEQVLAVMPALPQISF